MSKKKRVALIISIVLTVAAIVVGVVCAVKFGGNNQHTYDREVVSDEYLASPATCTHGAIYYKSCEHGKTGTETFVYGEPLGHDYGTWIAEDPATCTESGVKAHYHCARCGYDFDTAYVIIADLTIPAKGHSCDVWIDEVPATETEDGEMGHYHCPDCGKDIESDKKTEIEDVVISHTHVHDWGEITYTWTGTTSCTATRVCKLDSTHTQTATTTNIDHEVTTTATCVVKQVATYTATFAGDDASWMTTAQKTTTKNVDGEVDPNAHSFTNYTSNNDATCTAGGKKTATCDYGCGKTDTIDDESAPALGHDYEYTSVSGNQHKVTCTRCTYEETEDCSGGTATCTVQATCQLCNTKYGDYADHVYSEEEATEAYLQSAATCTAKAVYYKSCTACGKSSKDETEPQTFERGEPNGHTVGTAATCTEKAVCLTCGEPYGEVDPDNHNYEGATVSYDWVQDDSGVYTSCTAKRSCQRTGCTHEETATSTAVTPKETQKANCKYQQIITYTPTFADGVTWASTSKQVTGTTDSTVHVWDEWTSDGTTHTRTCKYNSEHTESGTCADDNNDHKCDVCGYTISVCVDVIKDSNGYSDHKCDVCGKTISEHSVGTAATCTAAAVCSICGESYGSTDPNNHDYGEWKSNGNDTHTKTCTRCGDKVTDDCLGGTATCTEQATCKDCNEKYGSSLGHDYSSATIKYTWNTAHTSCTATLACQREGCDYAQTATAEGTNITSSSTTATCVDKQVTTYKATFDADWMTEAQKTITAAVEGEVDAGNHDWGEVTYSWNDDYSVCTATRTCKRTGCTHEENVETNSITSTPKQAATCVVKQITTYTATFTGCAWITEPYSEDVEGDVDTTDGHSYGEWSSDGTTHTKTCSACSVGTPNHTVSGTCSGGTATCQARAICATCGKEYGEVDSSAHVWGDKYERVGENQHAKTCTVCGAVGDKVDCTKGEDGTCTVCGEGVSSVGLAYTYNSSAKTYSVSGLGTCTDTDIVIPSTYNDGTNGTAAVTAIAEKAFQNKTAITSITIPESVTSIGNYAFYGCSGLTSITIPDSVTSIGNYAFYGCRGLTSIIIPDSVTSIGICAFQSCKGLTSITISENVTSISNSMLRDCSGLTSVTIPDSVTSIGNDAFNGCSSLTSVTIPEGVTSIGENMFRDCSKLTSITIPNSVKRIGQSAFKSCSSLTSVTIPNNVTSIGNSAFYGCSGLTNITIPEGVTNIGQQAFCACNKLADIYITDIAKWCAIDELTNLMAYGSSSKSLYLNGEKITNLVIPDGVTKISSGAFRNSSLTSVTIPEGVTSIGGGAFYGCTGLTSITIPDSVTSIEGGLFGGCSSLTSVTIPEKVTNIGDSAFSGCKSLKSVTIPEGVTSIGSAAFKSCTGLTSVTIPEGVTSIGGGAFNSCSSLTSVTIGNNVESIGDSAFEYCNKLTTVYYGGTASQWSEIKIGNYNTQLTNATRYYKIDKPSTEADKPTTAGNYWYYDDEKKIQTLTIS